MKLVVAKLPVLFFSFFISFNGFADNHESEEQPFFIPLCSEKQAVPKTNMCFDGDVCVRWIEESIPYVDWPDSEPYNPYKTRIRKEEERNCSALTLIKKARLALTPGDSVVTMGRVSLRSKDTTLGTVPAGKLFRILAIEETKFNDRTYRWVQLEAQLENSDKQTGWLDLQSAYPKLRTKEQRAIERLEERVSALEAKIR